MEERLDDAINVLRNHAESQQLLGHGIPLPPHHGHHTHSTNGLLQPPNYHHDPSLEPHLVSSIDICMLFAFIDISLIIVLTYFILF